MHRPSLSSPALLLLALVLPLAGPVGCDRSVTNSEMLVEESKRDDLQLKTQKLDTEIKALNAELKDLTAKFGGADHQDRLRQIDALVNDKAAMEGLRKELAEKVAKFAEAAKAHRDYLATQEPAAGNGN
jgi:MoxR-like ATPase